MPACRPPRQGVAITFRKEEDGIYIVKRGGHSRIISVQVGLPKRQAASLKKYRNRDFIFEGQQLAIKPGVQPPAKQIASETETGGSIGVVDRTGAAAVASAPGPPHCVEQLGRRVLVG